MEKLSFSISFTLYMISFQTRQEEIALLSFNAVFSLLPYTVLINTGYKIHFFVVLAGSLWLFRSSCARELQ